MPCPSRVQFMGDYPAKNKTELDIVHKLGAVAHRYPDLRDELYCHVIKQTTNNRSERVESAARGWRLLVLLTAFCVPSAYFERFLRAYLQSTAFDNQREFQDQGMLCLRNLKQTMRLGGRRILPAHNELNAILSGKYTKIQKLYLPGEQTKSIKISAVTAVGDVVRQLCARLEVDAPGEFGVYIWTQKSENATLLQANDYVLDTTTLLEQKMSPHTSYRLYFRKLLWFTDNVQGSVFYVGMMFDQVWPDFLHARLLDLTNMPTEFLQVW